MEPSQYESTADFNKEIKELRRELIEEGKLDPVTGLLVSERESNFDIQIKVQIKHPLHPETQEVRQVAKPKQCFKLDLSKCSNVEDTARTVDHECDIQVDLMESSQCSENLVCTPKKSKRQIEKVETENQDSPKHQIHVVRRQHAQQKPSNPA